MATCLGGGGGSVFAAGWVPLPPRSNRNVKKSLCNLKLTFIDEIKFYKVKVCIYNLIDI